MDLRENRLLGAIRKWVNFAWYFSVAGSIIVSVVLLVFTFVPDAPVSGTMVLDISFFGANMAAVMPPGSVEPKLLRSMVLALYGFAVVEMPATLTALYQLKRILENVADRTPFIMENANRVRMLGLAIVSGSVLALMRGMVLGSFMSGRIHLEGFALEARLPRMDQLEVIGIGLAVLLLAEVFSYGVRLQEDRDLTV